MRIPWTKIRIGLTLTVCILIGKVSVGAEICQICTPITQAVSSNVVQDVIHSLPCIENLWPDNPEGYFQCTTQALRILGEALPSADARQVFLDLFANELEKGCATNAQEAIFCFNSKLEIIACCSGIEEVKTNKDSLLVIARFLGEVRSLRIPNYTNRGTAQPGWMILMRAGVKDANSLTNPVLKEAYEKAVRENQEDMIMNRLQLSLFRADRITTLYLLQYCSKLPLDYSQKADLLHKVEVLAHFTDEERMKISQ